MPPSSSKTILVRLPFELTMPLVQRALQEGRASIAGLWAIQRLRGP
jgi:hypothetical protein